jgi:hypothetical protein
MLAGRWSAFAGGDGAGRAIVWVGRVAEMKMLDKTEQSDRVSNPNEKPENCYCSVLPKGSGLCLPCYTRWLAGRSHSPNDL